MSLHFIEKGFINRNKLLQNIAIENNNMSRLYRNNDGKEHNAWADTHNGVVVILYWNKIAIWRPWQYANDVIFTIDDALRSEIGRTAVKAVIEEKVNKLREDKIKEINGVVNSHIALIASRFKEMNEYINENIKLLPDDVHMMIRSELATVVSESVANIINPKSKFTRLKDLIFNKF